MQAEDNKKYAKLDNFLMIKTLGSGFNSKVKLGLNTEDGKYYAVKIIKDTSHIDSNIKAILNETNVLKELDHPNIIKLYHMSDEGVYTKADGKQKKVMYATIQLAQGGEIFEYLASTGKFSEKVARFYFKQLIEALDHCHSKGFAHRDLKPENILLDETFNLVLADFGFATLLSGKDGSGKLKSVLGTESYMAPEIHSKAPYVGTSVDLFASGIILFIFITGHPPFNQAKATDQYYNLICMNNHERFWAAHSRKKPKGFFTQEFISLINAMLAFDPTQRPSLAEIKAHPWYNGETATAEEIQQEFIARKKMVDEQIKRQQEMLRLKKEREAARRAQMNKVGNNAAFKAPVATYRSVMSAYYNENQPIVSEKTNEILENMKGADADLKLERQDAQVHSVTTTLNNHYSPLAPVELFECIIRASDKSTKNIQANVEKLSIKMKVPTSGSYIGVKVKILECPEEGGCCAEYTRTSGSSLDYYEFIKKFNSQLTTDQEGIINREE